MFFIQEQVAEYKGGRGNCSLVFLPKKVGENYLWVHLHFRKHSGKFNILVFILLLYKTI